MVAELFNPRRAPIRSPRQQPRKAGPATRVGEAQRQAPIRSPWPRLHKRRECAR